VPVAVVLDEGDLGHRFSRWRVEGLGGQPFAADDTLGQERD
jgi:hypothetical protein